jgi:hypothetical protein
MTAVSQGSPYLARPARTRAQAIADIKAAGAAEERMRIADVLAERAANVEQKPDLSARHTGRELRRLAILFKGGLL